MAPGARIVNVPVMLQYRMQGQVKELDALAKSFVAAAAADRKKLLSKAQAAADAVDTSSNPDAAGYVEYYIKTMQRILDKGEGYAEQVWRTVPGHCGQESVRQLQLSKVFSKCSDAFGQGNMRWRLTVLFCACGELSAESFYCGRDVSPLQPKFPAAAYAAVALAGHNGKRLAA